MKPKRGATTPEREEGRNSTPEREKKDSKAGDGDARLKKHESKTGGVEALEEELEHLRAREEELLRAVAEMTNVQRRRKQETEQTVRYAQESLIRELLPVLDDFERALAAMPVAPEDPIRSGVELVQERMAKILEREGLEPIRPAGMVFDPTLHDAIGERPAPPGVTPGTVLDVAQPGYRLKDRVLRHAKVVVAGPPALGPSPSMAGDPARPPDTIPPPLDERDQKGT